MSQAAVPGKYQKRSASALLPPVIKMKAPEISNSSLTVVRTKESFLYKLNPTARLSLVVPLDHSWARFTKRVFDIIISCLVIICILSWFTPFMALLIKLTSRGPVFFLQKRSGRYNKLFTCIKFRSMVVNPQADLKAATINDERITKVGKFLRRYHWDELPQFFNVLLGDMSIIGPRPHMISDDLRYEEHIPHYNFRCRVKPGISGLAQTSGYSGCADDVNKMKSRVQSDFFYIRHWSLKLDFLILFHTFLKGIGMSLLPGMKKH